MRRPVATSILLFVSFLPSCEKDSELTSVPDDRPALTASDYDKILLRLSAYNVVNVTHQLGPELSSQEVVSIDVGTKDTTGFVQLFSAIAGYDSSVRKYIIHFDYSVLVDSSKAVVPMTVRYHLVDSTFVDVDTVAFAYRFPYQTAEVIVPSEALASVLRTHHLQDVDSDGQRVLFHPTAGEGLFAYDLDNGMVTELLSYNGGDYIAAESVFVFCDVDHDEIWRYNLLSGKVDLTIPGTGMDIDAIRGMDAYQGYLYICRNGARLSRYTLEGILVDSLEGYWTSTQMTIHDSIIYDVEDGGSILRRYDMRTGSFLQAVLSPAHSTEGLQAYNGKLFYCDFEKGFIGAVPIEDLRTQ